MDIITAIIVLAIVLVALAMIFHGDKLFRFMGWDSDESPSAAETRARIRANPLVGF